MRQSPRHLAGALALGALALLGAPSAAQDSPFGGFKHDSSTPIEITSDRLEVREAESIAIFSGSVEAGQGTLRLTANRLVVLFDPDEQDSETGAIRNVTAEGDVFVSNGSETAEGDTGEYDVESGLMFLRGDVLLTQGGNAVSGPELRIDFNTGVAQMTGGRVKSVFRPARGQQGN